MWNKAFLVVFLFLFVNRVQAQVDRSLYGYYVYTIAKMVEWPDEYDTEEFVIGVLGDSPVVENFKTLASRKQIKGKNIKVVVLENPSDEEIIHMLFLPVDESGKMEQVLRKLDGSSTMLITESEGLALKGSCINFIVLKNNKTGFELNRAALKKANLAASPDLKRFAIVL